ncbi:MAG: hypothetical protein IE931_11450 [Sphingobacteriales bacterium]|nr:hypothetical protein [Sphingobacteriales bacterium]
MNNILTLGQQKAIKSIIILTEEKILEIEKWLYFTTKQEEIGIQSQIINDLTTEDKEVIQLKIEEIRKILKAFSAYYNLQNLKEFKSLKNIITTKACFMWEDISGSTFNRLKGYGDIDEEKRVDYEQFINPLENLIKDIIYLKI